MWALPEAVIQGQSSEAAFQWIKDQLVDAESFLAKIEFLNTNREQESRDEIPSKTQNCCQLQRSRQKQ